MRLKLLGVCATDWWVHISSMGIIEEIRDITLIKEWNREHPDNPVGEVIRSPYLSMDKELVRFPNGELGTYFQRIPVVPGNCCGVMIIPVYQGKVIMIHEFRYGARKYLWQFPAGGIQEGESLEECARRELKEEIGANVKDLRILRNIQVESGFNRFADAVAVAEIESYQEVYDPHEPVDSVQEFSISEVLSCLTEQEPVLVDHLGVFTLYLASLGV